MKRTILDKDTMQKAIKEAVPLVAGIVKRTLGPGGLPIFIERQGQQLNGDPLGPQMTKDGVTVANNCFLENESHDLVVQAIKTICQRTNKRAGDGTTTGIVLGEAILNEAFLLLDKDTNLNPQLLKESIMLAVKGAIRYLDSIKIKVNDLDVLESVAAISANGDMEVARVLRKAFDEVGAEGVITVDEGAGRDVSVDVVQGFQIRRGSELKERFFNNTEGTRFEAENAYVILYDGSLNNPAQALNALRKIFEAMQTKNEKVFPPVVFVANEFTEDVLTFLMMQKVEANLTVCAVRSPHVTVVRTQMLDDMAIILGGSRLGSGTRSLSEITMEDIGFCEKVSIDKYTATFYDGAGDEEEVLKRIDSIKKQRDMAESDHDAAILSDRISALNQAVAKIGVGGSTDLEIKERYHRIEDALNAARAAIEEGVVPGGGMALFRYAEKLKLAKKKTLGEKVLENALQAPFYQILENIGMSKDKLDEDFKKTLLESPTNTVYDARNKEFSDAFEAGILDPVKVTKEALLNASSIAELLSTCGGGIVFTRKH